MKQPILAVEIRTEHDVVLTRQRARQVAALLGFDSQDQTRFATAVSEIARNAHRFGRGGRAEFFLESEQAQTLMVRISDSGPGIADLRAVLDGRSGGLGIVSARRLSDVFEFESRPGEGTSVLLGKALPRGSPWVMGPQVSALAQELTRRSAETPLEEIRQQNQELLRTLEALRQRQAEVERLNRELEETNRGVLALYAELDEKAESLRRASDLKSHFLSNMTHELRTPLNSIIMLSRLLLQRDAGDLNEEQEKQVSLINRSSESLLELVNDLLDLAKIEAGKVDLRLHEFRASDVLIALRGMFRPLATNPRVELVFEHPVPDPLLYSDEGKVSQILRNFISNALKFTQRGSIVVKAGVSDEDVVVFSVSDTGIGISPEDQQRLFREFSQLETKLSAGVKGTGLGLSLSRRLAEIVGGHIQMESQKGVGSRFSAHIPLHCPQPTMEERAANARAAEGGQRPQESHYA